MTHSRRLALQLGAKAVLGLLAARTWAPARAAAPLDWARFLDQLSALAEAQFSEAWDTEAYVEDVAVLMRALDVRDRPFRRFLRQYKDTVEGRPAVRRAHAGGHFSVATLHFEPGEVIGLHDHPRMTGVIFGLEGAARVTAFDRSVHPDRPGWFRLRQVEDAVVRPGHHASLTPDRGNVHTLRADVPTTLLDVFTPPYDPPRAAAFRWYERSAGPTAGAEVFDAWERPAG